MCQTPISSACLILSLGVGWVYPMSDLPVILQTRLRYYDQDPLACSINGLCLTLDTDALVWHNITVADLVHALLFSLIDHNGFILMTAASYLSPNHPDVYILPAANRLSTDGEPGWVLYVVVQRLRRLVCHSDPDAPQWFARLPPMQTLLQQTCQDGFVSVTVTMETSSGGLV